jgi:hypothetical protein
MPYPPYRLEPDDTQEFRSSYKIEDDFKGPTYPDWDITQVSGTGSIATLVSTDATTGLAGYEAGGGIVQLTTGTAANDYAYMFHNEPIFWWNVYAPMQISFWIKYTEALTDDVAIIVGVTERVAADVLGAREEPLKDGGSLDYNHDGPDTAHHAFVVHKRADQKYWRVFQQNDSNFVNNNHGRLDLVVSGVPTYAAGPNESTITLTANITNDQFRDYGEEVKFITGSTLYQIKRRTYDANDFPVLNTLIVTGDASGETTGDNIDLYNKTESTEWQYVEAHIGRQEVGGRTNATANFTVELFQSSHGLRRKRSCHDASWTGGNANASSRKMMRALIGIKKLTAGTAEKVLIDGVRITQGRSRHV